MTEKIAELTFATKPDCENHRTEFWKSINALEKAQVSEHANIKSLRLTVDDLVVDKKAREKQRQEELLQMKQSNVRVTAVIVTLAEIVTLAAMIMIPKVIG